MECRVQIHFWVLTTSLIKQNCLCIYYIFLLQDKSILSGYNRGCLNWLIHKIFDNYQNNSFHIFIITFFQSSYDYMSTLQRNKICLYFFSYIYTFIYIYSHYNFTYYNYFKNILKPSICYRKSTQ